MEEAFQLDALSSLIDDPSQCRRLSLTALKINLSLHVKCDAASMERATKADLASRFEEFLLIRRADILLRGFVFGGGGDMDVDWESEGSF